MGSSQSTESTLTIDKTLVEQHLNELSKMKTDFATVTAEYQELKQQVTRNEIIFSSEIEKTKKELLRKENIIQGNIQFRNTLNQLIREKQADNAKLQTQNEYLQRQLSTLSSEVCSINNQLKQSSEQCQRNKEKHEKTCNTLNSQYVKVQSELQRFKNNAATVKLCEIYQQLQKFDSQIEATTKKLAKEIKVNERIANEDVLKKHMEEYNQCKEILNRHQIFTSDVDLETVLKKYKDLSVENDNKTKDVMRKVYVINKAAKLTSEQLKTDISNTTNSVKTLIEKHQKELTQLKQVSFSTDFKQEEKNFLDALQLLHEQKQKLNNLIKVVNQKNFDEQNNLNNSEPTKFTNKSNPQAAMSFQTSTSDEFNIILYNFPERTDELEHIKYFLCSFQIGNVNKITARRLAISGDEKIRPVVVSLPSYEAVNKILTSSHKIKELEFPNVKIAKYNGKMKDNFEAWLETLRNDDTKNKSQSKKKQKKKSNINNNS